MGKGAYEGSVAWIFIGDGMIYGSRFYVLGLDYCLDLGQVKSWCLGFHFDLGKECSLKSFRKEI